MNTDLLSYLLSESHFAPSHFVKGAIHEVDANVTNRHRAGLHHCLYARVYVCVCMCVSLFLPHIIILQFMCMCVCVCARVCMHTFACISVCACVLMRVYARVRESVCVVGACAYVPTCKYASACLSQRFLLSALPALAYCVRTSTKSPCSIFFLPLSADILSLPRFLPASLKGCAVVKGKLACNAALKPAINCI